MAGQFYDRDKLLKDREGFIKRQSEVAVQIQELTAEQEQLPIYIASIDNILAFIDAGYPTPPQQDAPEDFEAVSGEQQAVLSWAAADGATGYIIERSASADYSNAVEIYNDDALTYTDENLATGATYYYRLKATSEGKSDSEWQEASVIILEQLGEPQNLEGTSEGGTATITFDFVPFANSYRVYRTTEDTPPAEGTEIATIEVNTYTDDDETLVPDNTYWYWVQADSDYYRSSTLASTDVTIVA